MNKCLVTRLKATINKDIERLGEVIFVKYATTSDVTIRIYGDGYARGIGCKFLLNGEYVDRVQLGSITVSKDSGYIVIENKYNLASVDASIYDAKVAIPANKLQYIGGGKCTIFNAIITGTITNSMQYLYGTPNSVMFSNIDGEIEDSDYVHIGTKIKTLDVTKFSTTEFFELAKIFTDDSITRSVIIGNSNNIKGYLDDLKDAPKLDNVAVGSTSSFKCRWSSPSLRNSSLPVIKVNYSPVFMSSTDVDNYLINMSNCAAVNVGNIMLGTQRTIASDNAVSILKAKGYHIYINNVEQ